MNIFIIIVVIMFLVIILSEIKSASDLKEKAKKGIDAFPLGLHLFGFEKIPSTGVFRGILCVVTENDFVFFKRDELGSLSSSPGWPSVFLLISSLFSKHDDVVGSIPRNAINQILIDDKSQTLQRLSATKILTFGAFALSAPKAVKHQEYCLIFNWDDKFGNKQNIIFEFSSADIANKVYLRLIKYIKPKAEITKENEKKCTYCAEVIKKEAIVCRFCGKDV